MKWLLLGIAIVFEVIATTALKYCDNFKKLIPSIIVVVGYGVSFYVFSYAIKYLPLGVSYAVWSGVGLVLISLIGFILFKQSFDLPGVIGILMIAAGIIVLNVFSKMVR